MSLHLARAPLLPAEYRLLRDLVKEHAGLCFDDDALFTFERRLWERVAALGLTSFGDYYKYLRFHIRGSAELEEALELLVTKETYFFRQDYQLRSFQQELLPRLAEQHARQRRLTLWSAGCSTGEEAYTLAILLHETGRFEGWDVRVVGSDLSRGNVAMARRGVYRERSLRSTSPAHRRQYFVETAEGFQVIDSIRRYCQFGQLNLFDANRARTVGPVDVVFCRNVIIYFDMKSRRRVIDNLYERLRPGGYLLMGHSESLINLSTAFELVHLQEDLVYRKPSSVPLGGGALP